MPEMKIILNEIKSGLDIAKKSNGLQDLTIETIQNEIEREKKWSNCGANSSGLRHM